MADSEASPQHFDEGIAGEVSATDGQNILGQIIEVDPAVVSNYVNPSIEAIVVNCVTARKYGRRSLWVCIIGGRI